MSRVPSLGSVGSRDRVGRTVEDGRGTQRLPRLAGAVREVLGARSRSCASSLVSASRKPCTISVAEASAARRDGEDPDLRVLPRRGLHLPQVAAVRHRGAPREQQRPAARVRQDAHRTPAHAAPRALSAHGVPPHARAPPPSRRAVRRRRAPSSPSSRRRPSADASSGRRTGPVGRGTTRAPLPGSAVGSAAGAPDGRGAIGPPPRRVPGGRLLHGHRGELGSAAVRQTGVIEPAVAPRVLGLQRYRGAAQRLVRGPRQRQPELGTAARLAPRLEPAAVQPGVLQGDGQPEAGAAGGTRAGRVGPPEAVEHPGRLAGLEPDAVVADGDGDRPARRGELDHDVLALAVLDGVDDEVAQHPLDPPGVRLGDHAAAASPTTRIRVPLRSASGSAPLDHPAHDVPQVDRRRPPAPPRPRRTG